MIGSRGAAALLAAVAVTALLTGCQPLSTGAAGVVPTTEASSVEPSPNKTAKPTATRAPRPGSSATPTAKPKPKATQPEALLKPGDHGEKVRELQVRLRQLDWYAGSITGKYGSSTVKGVKGFQGKRGLEEDREGRPTTWSQLRSGRGRPPRTSGTTSWCRAARSRSRARAATRSASCRPG